MKNKFKKVTEEDRRLKLFLFGTYGTGKTYLALQFPGIAIIDPEKGAKPYAKVFNFSAWDIEDYQSFQEYEDAITYLGSEKHQFKTLVIDPMTMMYEVFLYHWSNIFMKRNTRGAGFKFDFYEFQIKDYNTIAAHWKAFIRRILSLDMNIICIAREKNEYTKTDSDMMKLVGKTCDIERRTPYYFDTVVQLVTKEGKHLAIIKKDRNDSLGLPIDTEVTLNYEMFETNYPNLHKESHPVYVSEEHVKEFQQLVNYMNLPADKVQSSLQKYGVESFEELHLENGLVILEKMRAFKAKKEKVVVNTSTEAVKESAVSATATEDIKPDGVLIGKNLIMGDSKTKEIKIKNEPKEIKKKEVSKNGLVIPKPPTTSSSLLKEVIELEEEKLDKERNENGGYTLVELEVLKEEYNEIRESDKAKKAKEAKEAKKVSEVKSNKENKNNIKKEVN